MFAIKKETLDYIREELFANHRAVYTAPDPNDSDSCATLCWREPGTDNNSIRYVLYRNYVFVCDNLGDAVFCLTEKARPERLAKYGVHYLYGKMSCMSGTHKGIVFDAELAKSAIDEYVNDTGDDGIPASLVTSLKRAADESSSVENWRSELYSLEDDEDLNDYFPDWWEWLVNAGSAYSLHFLSYWLGLRMAWEAVNS